MLAYSKMGELKSELEHKLAVAEESVATTSNELTSALENFSQKKESLEKSLKGAQDELQAKLEALANSNKQLCDLQVSDSDIDKNIHMYINFLLILLLVQHVSN